MEKSCDPAQTRGKPAEKHLNVIMFVIIGILVVFGAVIGGYLMEHGHLAVLMQPAELVIIGGAAMGTLLISNPLPTVIKLFKGVLSTFGSSKFDQKYYLQGLQMLNEVFSTARKGGLVKLEADIEAPDKSPLFGKYGTITKDHHILHFICDTLRMAVSGGVGHFELDQMMELDMETHHHEAAAPIAALSTVADALPGLGIVAAVLGVVVTMGSLGGPPEEIGHKVAAALVGTFLGILLCYGLLGPMAANLTKRNDEEGQFYHFLRVGLVSFLRGNPPILAVEFARRAIPASVRPSFQQMESACKGGGAAAAA